MRAVGICLLLAPAFALAGPTARDWAELGLEKGRAGRHAEAVEALRRSLEMDPKDARAWNNLGAALGRLGKSGEEVDAYRKALDLEPDLEAAWRNLDAATAGRSQSRVTASQSAGRPAAEAAGSWSRKPDAGSPDPAY